MSGYLFTLEQTMDRPSWDQYFMGMAHYASIRSHDSETRVGCVLVNTLHHVVGMGYNGFPAQCNDAVLPTFRPEKYPFMVHAEENAVSNMERRCVGPLKAYITHYPCFRCAKLLWQNGVNKWYIEKGAFVSSKNDNDTSVHQFLVKNGLEIYNIETNLDLKIN